MEVLIALGVAAAFVLWASGKRRPGSGGGGVERGQAGPASQSGSTPGGALAGAARDAQERFEAGLDRFRDAAAGARRFYEEHPAAAAAGGPLAAPGAVVEVAHYGDAGQSPRAR